MWTCFLGVSFVPWLTLALSLYPGTSCFHELMTSLFVFQPA